MKKINVIDLDLTLINYDSFRKLIINELLKFQFYIIIITFFRLLRLINKLNYKRRIFLYLENKYDETFFKTYASNIFNDIDKNLLNYIESNTNSNTINILLSASPDLYVSHILKMLSWQGSGSYFDVDRNFHNLTDTSKISWLNENFNPSQFEYNLAISDNDFELLKLFQKKKIIN